MDGIHNVWLILKTGKQMGIGSHVFLKRLKIMSRKVKKNDLDHGVPDAAIVHVPHLITGRTTTMHSITYRIAGEAFECHFCSCDLRATGILH
jgi:hypothetical protein